MVKAIVGANWGDEGKGKITDLLAEESDVVIRFQGGANAGHTIICDYGKFALHQLPSGVFYPHTTNIIGNGVALDVPKFVQELKTLTDGGVPAPHIIVDQRTQVLMPYHVLQDTYEEERLAGAAFGSTKSGIAPFYSDKYAKIGIQVCDLFDEKRLMERLEHVCVIKNVLFEHLYHKPALDPKELFNTLMGYRDMIAPYVGDAVAYVHQALKEGKKILLEGQLGSMKDPDLGIYPFTTSSHTLAGYGCVGAAVPPSALTEVVCVTKAYSSAVGAGAFVSELFGDEADELRRRGGDAGEFGATTGRPRRVGWFDAVATRYGCMVQGATEAALTAIDCLGYLDEIKVCTGYEIDGKVTTDFPVSPLLDKAKPVYETLPGWKTDIRGITEYDKLPKEARDYVDFIEKHIGVPVKTVSTGPKRHEIIRR
ncbi:MAG: adenylosuccinate synthase [Pseudoflavonifractor capillosus]|uniref:adenylosuccinate synthase n=1 Tax=Pseudoflavonifractor capillosus TaxID=106588 RepID=UPI0023F9C8FD|nr:adenylosuccinate synthase [Pseudoflavonifractor capillosus]MCI5928799.1 adenylosuccinate synthase [Pseudoflavonifractor capillosus]MDY4660283.1 adenylosuccinate synthase [Pseudoflavonifractor capillosus]